MDPYEPGPVPNPDSSIEPVIPPMAPVDRSRPADRLHETLDMKRQVLSPHSTRNDRRETPNR